jgi:hypothetical protein
MRELRMSGSVGTAGEQSPAVTRPKEQWIIKKGLIKGERVIYDGLQKVRPGVLVKIKEKDSIPKES